METEFIKEKLDIKNNRKSKYMCVIEEWEETDNKTLRFKCTSEKEKNSCYSSAKQYIKKHNLDWTVVPKGYDIYVVRA